MKKTTKRKITTTAKRVVKPPSQSVVLSLMALILIVGAPAIVSMIDDSYTYEGSSETQLLDIDNSTAKIVVPTVEDPLNAADASYIPASLNDGTFVIALNDSSLVSDVSHATFYLSDMASIISDTGAVKVVTSSDVDSIKVQLHGSAADTSIYLIRSESDPSVWTGSFDSVELVKIKSGLYRDLWVRMNGSNEFFEFEIFAVGEYVIPYGEIIIGATGGLLIICALFATPWFGIGGINTKPRRSK